MDPELVAKARARQVELMSKVEQAIAKLYQAKDRNDHLNIWYAVTALEIYKMQSTLLFDALIAGLVITPEQQQAATDIRTALTDQLQTISGFCGPLLMEGGDAE